MRCRVAEESAASGRGWSGRWFCFSFCMCGWTQTVHRGDGDESCAIVNHQDWRGIQISFVLCPWVLFYDEHTPCKSLCSNLAFSGLILPYLGDYVHFLGINAHNSNSNNPRMKRFTGTVWKTMHVLFSKFSCLLQGMGRDFKEMCDNSQPQTFILLVFYNIGKWNTWLKNMTPGMVPWYSLTMPW